MDFNNIVLHSNYFLTVTYVFGLAEISFKVLSESVLHKYWLLPQLIQVMLGSFHKLRLHMGWVGGQKNV